MSLRRLLLLALVLLLAPQLVGQGVLPEVVDLGPGTVGSAARIDSGPPVLGADFLLRASGLPAGSQLTLHHSLPPLAPIGGSGHTLFLDAASAQPFALLGPGQRIVRASLPDLPWLEGLKLVVQGVASPTGSGSGFELTNGLRLRLGRRAGPLAGLPSWPGPTVAALAALPPGGWLDLGVPAPDPLMGLPTGRSYTPRMAWSSVLEGAFLTGEGLHGFVHPTTGRYIDDVWFYDLPAHRWICVKPGSEVATLHLLLNPDGFEISSPGKLVPVAQLGHGYELVTYDELNQRFFMQPLPNTYWLPHMPQRLEWLTTVNQPASQYRSPWLFEAVRGRWERRPPGLPQPDFNVAARAVAVQAVANEGRVLVFDTSPVNAGRVWWFDAVACTWQDEATTNNAPAIAGNGVSCYDRVNDRFWFYGVEQAGQTAGLWYLDLATMTWVAAGGAGTPAASVIYATADNALSFDEAANTVLLIKDSGNSGPIIHPFDVATATWGAAVTIPAALAPHFLWAGQNVFHAPEYGVHILHVSPGGTGTGRIIAYRHI